jgi:hypothetical protein
MIDETINDIHALVAATVKNEQDRIIKLLQDRIDNHMKAGLPDDGYCACTIYEYTIALIKGEEE